MVGHLSMREAFSEMICYYYYYYYYCLLVWSADQGGIAIEVCLVVPNWTCRAPRLCVPSSRRSRIRLWQIIAYIKYIYIYIYMHISLSLSLSLSIYIYIYTHTYIYIYIHIYIYILIIWYYTILYYSLYAGQKNRSVIV